MFTGIVEELGKISSKSIHNGLTTLEVLASPAILTSLKTGDSISVNGCCLTAVNISPTSFQCNIIPETLKRTSLGSLKTHDLVNLELSVRLQDRLGGHLVQGHIDGIGTISTKTAQPDGSWWISITTPSDILRYLIFKGSIAIDGISMTIANVDSNSFSVGVIPHTAKMTTLGFKKPGDSVNLEIDMIAKYVEVLCCSIPSKKL